jgi:hypothetical protein
MAGLFTAAVSLLHLPTVPSLAIQPLIVVAGWFVGTPHRLSHTVPSLAIKQIQWLEEY